MQAGLAGTMLAALSLSLMLFYGMGSALTTRNAYAGMALRREIQDLRAENALVRYQINLTGSNQRIQQAAAGLKLRPADAAREIDYVFLPYSGQDRGMRLATSSPSRDTGGLAAALAELAMEVTSSARGRAEASTGESHRP